MITARELVFYIRAEDQASRVVKRASKNFGGLSKIRGLENQLLNQQAKNYRAIEKAQIAIRRNEEAILRAQIQADKINKAVASKSGRYGTNTRAQTLQLQQASQMRLGTLARDAALLATNEDEVRKAAEAATKAIERQNSEQIIARQERFISAIQGTARSIRLLGVVALASFGVAAHQAAEFNTQLTLAASQARPAGAPASRTAGIATKLQQVVLDQMQKFPAASQDMADSLYQIFSSTNIQGIKQAGTFLNTLNKAAVAGGTDLKSMTDATLTLFNNFVGKDKEFKNVTDALNVFFAAVRYGRMSATQYAGSLSRVVSSGVAVGQTFKDISGAMAALTRQTGAARTGFDATGLARLYEILVRPDVVAGLKKIGVNEIDPVTNKLKPLLQVITDIKRQADLKGINAINFFKTISAAGGGGKGLAGTIQGRRAFQYLIQDLQNYQKVSKDIGRDNNEFSRSFQALSKSPGVRWQVFMNQIKALTIIIGTEAIPAFVSLGKYVAQALKWFNGLSDRTKHDIGYWGVYASIIAVVGSTILILIGSIGKLVLTFRLLKLEALAGEAGFATAKFSLFTAAVVGLGVALFKYPHQVHAVINALGGLEEVIKGLLILTTVVSFRKLLLNIGLIGTAAAKSGTQVTGLRLALLKLRALGPIAIAVGITEIFTHKGQIDKAVSSFVDKHAKFLGGSNPKTIQDLRDSLGTKSVTNDALMGLAHAAAGGDKKAQKWINKIMGRTSPVTEAMPKLTSNNLRVGQQAIKNNTVAVIVHAKEVVKATANWKALFGRVVELDKIAEKSPTIKNFKRLLDAQDALQKASTGNQYSAAQQYLGILEGTWNKAEKVTEKHSKNMAAINAKNVANAKTEIGNLVGGIQGMYDNLLQANQSVFGDLFGGPVVSGARVQNELQFGGHITGKNLLDDIKGQVFQFHRINRQVDALGKRGAPKEFLDQIRAMGPSARDDIKALQQLTPTQFKQYINAWNAGQAAIKQNTMRQLNNQLKIYQSHGKKIAMAIIKGIQSENVALSNVLKNSILQMFPGLASQAGAKPGLKLPDKISGSGENHTHYHVVAPTSEHTAVKTQLRHLDFVARNTYGGNNF